MMRLVHAAAARSYRRVLTDSRWLSSTIDKESASFDARSDTDPLTPESPFAQRQTPTTTSATGDSKKRPRQSRHSFVPLIAAVKLTDNARTFFKALLQDPPRPEIIGVMLNYDQSKTSPRMVFSFSFVTANDITMQDEGVSLELIENESHKMVPKPPAESRSDILPKLYVHHNAFLKVLGATVDVDTSTVTPILYDRESNRMDPNA